MSTDSGKQHIRTADDIKMRDIMVTGIVRPTFVLCVGWWEFLRVVHGGIVRPTFVLCVGCWEFLRVVHGVRSV